MLKDCPAMFLAAILFYGLLLVGTLRSDTAGATTVISGVISSDTEWLSTRAPYNLSGTVTIARGVTLTIRGGTEVNLGKSNLIVEGTLHAQGITGSNIVFTSEVPNEDVNPGQIVFSDTSSNWNEQTGSGSLIENAILLSTRIVCKSSVKINNNTVTTQNGGWITADGSSPIISNNTITGGIYVTRGGSPTILNNTITNAPQRFSGIYAEDSSPLISRNTMTNWSKIEIYRGNTVIANNTFAVGESLKLPYYDPDLFLGTIYISGAFTSTVSNNTVTGASPEYDGIIIEQNEAAGIDGNIISGFRNGINIAYGNATFERNLLANNYAGIKAQSIANIAIRNNTIINNSIGIDIKNVNTTAINFNNIHNNTQKNIWLLSSLYGSGEINATNNWWGTTNRDLINQTIYDNKNDSSLAKVNFEPFLNESYTGPTEAEETQTVPIDYAVLATVAAIIIVGAIITFSIHRRKKA